MMHATITQVSVVLCTRNRHDSLRNAIQAILGSELRDFGLIVVDQSDGDVTEGIVEEVCRNDKRVCYVKDLNRGASSARNVGLGRSKGKIIAFTDDDCMACPDWLGTLSSALEADSRA